MQQRPFAQFVLAHLKTQDTQRDPDSRCRYKVQIIKRLCDTMPLEDMRHLFRVIDWMMDLSDEVAGQFMNEMRQVEEEKQVRFITTPERLGRKQGREEGRKEGLLEALDIAIRIAFPTQADELLSAAHEIRDPEQLQTVLEAILYDKTAANLRALIEDLGQPDRAYAGMVRSIFESETLTPWRIVFNT